MRQSRAIKVTNLNGKAQTDKEMHKHGDMLPASIRAVVCGSSNCGKTNVLISLLESPHGIRFENVYVYSKSLQQLKYRYLANLLTPIEEISYFTFSNNTTLFHQALPNTTFIFNDMRSDKKVFCKRMTRGRRLLLSLSDVCKDTEAPYNYNANLLILFKQDGTNLKRVYNDHVNMSCENFCDLCRKC